MLINKSTGVTCKWMRQHISRIHQRDQFFNQFISVGNLSGILCWPTKDSAEIPDADELIEKLVPLMDPGDMLAHPFTRHPGGFVNQHGEVHPILLEAVLNNGVRVDVGHGSHFS